MIINERFHDAITGEVTDIQREATPEELKRHKEILAERAEAEALRFKADADKAALLAKLGITADEVKLLLG